MKLILFVSCHIVSCVMGGCKSHWMKQRSRRRMGLPGTGVWEADECGDLELMHGTPEFAAGLWSL